MRQKKAKLSRRIAEIHFRKKATALNNAYLHALIRSPFKVRWVVGWRVLLGWLPEHLRHLDEED